MTQVLLLDDRKHILYCPMIPIVYILYTASTISWDDHIYHREKYVFFYLSKKGRRENVILITNDQRLSSLIIFLRPNNSYMADQRLIK